MSRSRRCLLAFLVLAIAAPLAAAGPPPQANDQKTVAVMTQNLYVGADLAPAVAAVASGDFEAIVTAVSDVWKKVQLTDFNARAEGLAREIKAAQPALIGLQEAELWRSQTPADFVPGNAEHVESDFVATLLDALAGRGLHYAVVVEETGFDAEFPGFLSDAAALADELSDIRLTDREVILARTDLQTSELKLSNPQSGNFETNIEIPIASDGTFVLLRGWAAVDAKVRGKSFRFVTTHLESDLESDSERVREYQAAEILAGPADTSLPVLLVGDLNSNANGDSSTPAYSTFIGSGFVDGWLEANPGTTVSTCCNAEPLTNPTFPSPSDDFGRIDHILYRGARDFRTLGASLFGTDPADRVSIGLTLIWPSDHAGLAATLEIEN
jgi:endonuclease/exonuclease/phosphatase family metal-dependent hydrolase